MQAKLVDSMPVGAWIYEIKFDGYRALALRGGNETLRAGFLLARCAIGQSENPLN